MKLVFAECDYGKDFECLECAPVDWPVSDEAFVWFKAYDTSLCESDDERELHDAGYAFECMVWLERSYMGHRDYLMRPTPVQNKQEAERLLQIAADALYE